MSLVVQEERLRRLDGLSTRIAGGLVPEAMGSRPSHATPHPANSNLQPLHARGTVSGMMSSTVAGAIWHFRVVVRVICPLSGVMDLPPH